MRFRTVRSLRFSTGRRPRSAAMGKVGNGKVGKGKGKAGGKGKAKDQGGDAHNKRDQITRPLVCHPSVLQHSETPYHRLRVTTAKGSRKRLETYGGKADG